MYTSGILPHVDETERVSNNPKKEKPLEKTKTLMYFDSNVSRDGMNEGKSL